MENEIRRTCPLYYHMATHTHTHAGDDGGRCSLHFPILASSPRDSQEQWAASDAAPGDQVQVLGPDLVRVKTDESIKHYTSCLCEVCTSL